MKYIELTKKLRAIVDDEDYPLLSRHKWHAQVAGATHYAATKNTSLGHLFMHSLVCPRTKGRGVIDHIDGNGLNNKRENLRAVSYRNNGLNNTKHRKASSVYRGVSLDKQSGKWTAQITDRVRHRVALGYFPTEVAAAMAYDMFARDAYGEFAKLNFTVVAHS